MAGSALTTSQLCGVEFAPRQSIRCTGTLAPHNQERHISHKMLSSTSYDGSGLWVAAKKLDGGRFRWPESDTTATKMVLSQEELALLLGGIDLKQTQPRKWYRKLLAEEPEKLRIPL